VLTVLACAGGGTVRRKVTGHLGQARFTSCYAPSRPSRPHLETTDHHTCITILPNILPTPTCF
jgi:hypothetical protein